MKLDVFRIKIEMARKGLSIAEVARAANRNPQQFTSALRRGRCNTKVLHLFAVALGVDPIEIVVKE